MATFDFNGIALDGFIGGEGPPLLVLHGGNGPVGTQGLAERLAKDFKVYMPVHPGFGTSPVVEHFDHIDDLAYLYLDLLDQLDLHGVSVLGTSMGGWLAAEIAVKSTARLKSLVLADAVGFKFKGREDREIADLFGVPPAAIAGLVWHDPSKAPDPAAMSEAEQVLALRNREALARYGWKPYLHDPKLVHRVHRIDIPVLVVWGESDGIVGVEYGKAIADALPDARFEVIKGAGHAPQTEQAEAFDAAVRAFLREAVPAE